MAAPLPNPWVAVDPASDRVAQARALRRAHEAAVAAGRAPDDVRRVVAQSWERSGRAGIDPEGHLAPVRFDEDETGERWRAHPLFGVLPVLRSVLSDATAASGHVLAISDADGVLLWIEGHQHVLSATEDMHFVAGADWSERGAGTNALGTALAEDHPVQIFSAEHFARRVHQWQCSGAPIHDPLTGRVLGVVDLTGDLRTAHPHTLALVTAAAGMAEAELRRQGPIAVVSQQLELELLTRRPRAFVGGREVALSQRHGELLALLLARPEGMTAEGLTLELYGEEGKPVTVRAELSRLRRLLGPALGARPYRLEGVDADVLHVERLVGAGRLAEALGAYRDVLLPASEVPLVEELRGRLDGLVRAAVRRSGDPSLLARWCVSAPGHDDEPAARELAALVPADDPAGAAARAQLARLARLHAG
ncbi:GAF domain-containing protein [Conexibacter sp. SYSU D00693]|uniref:GAF domain-containing protein n=1 Tax=Conexibacter sp. SYSU D00693 TaxID=2812560 RepID=UPI00196B2D89|nr:GAF domain-containing protein [Conexibacter sp. SYSU D00693]